MDADVGVTAVAQGDAVFMERALALAEHGRRSVSPNPLVGCVVVADGAVVGEGFHERPGGPHAEVVALEAAGPRARGATVYVTLEPCAHTGRTPPCTEALYAAGVARVVAAVEDPHPRAGGGAAALRAAGVPVRTGVLADAARRQNEVFLHGVAKRRPFVVAKTAVSLDGRIAAADGTSRWLTGAAARTRAHERRADVDAVLVGSGTVLADDPALTVRLPGQPTRPPLRVVLDGRGRVGPGHQVCDGTAPTLVFAAPGREEALAGCGVEVVAAPPASGGGLDLGRVLAELWNRAVRSVIVEGGARVVSAFLTGGLADRLDVHVAPLLLGEKGRPAVVGDGIATLEGAPRFRLAGVDRAGDDVVLTLYPGND